MCFFSCCENEPISPLNLALSFLPVCRHRDLHVIGPHSSSFRFVRSIYRCGRTKTGPDHLAGGRPLSVVLGPDPAQLHRTDDRLARTGIGRGILAPVEERVDHDIWRTGPGYRRLLQHPRYHRRVRPIEPRTAVVTRRVRIRLVLSVKNIIKKNFNTKYTYSYKYWNLDVRHQIPTPLPPPLSADKHRDSATNLQLVSLMVEVPKSASRAPISGYWKSRDN